MLWQTRNDPRTMRTRMERALLSLEGLSVGDAFGGRFNFRTEVSRALPPPPWYYSDDTVMALAIVEILDRHGRVEQEELARLFARRYQADPYRGYGLSVRRVLERIDEGAPWQIAAREVFGGTGSMGNGGAMRVAPLGAYFADDLDAVVEQARASAAVTHTHAEGQAGAIATAVAAAWAWNVRHLPEPRSGRDMLAVVLEHTPDGETRTGLERAISLGLERTGRGGRFDPGQWQPDHLAGYRAVRPLVCRPSSRRLRRGALGHRLGGRGQRHELCDRRRDRRARPWSGGDPRWLAGGP